MEIAQRISVQEGVHFGKPVIAGTRVPVEVVLGKLAGGVPYEELMAEYEITRKDILAVLDYAVKAYDKRSLAFQERDIAKGAAQGGPHG